MNTGWIRGAAVAAALATLLPSAAFFLKLGRYAPARMLIEQGAAVALATDLNPGGGFTTSMPFVLGLAVRDLHMTIDEAIWSATAGGAAALQRAFLAVHGDARYLEDAARLRIDVSPIGGDGVL